MTTEPMVFESGLEALPPRTSHDRQAVEFDLNCGQQRHLQTQFQSGARSCSR